MNRINVPDLHAALHIVPCQEPTIAHIRVVRVSMQTHSCSFMRKTVEAVTHLLQLIRVRS